MGDENVILYDETSPIEHSQRNVIYYNSRPEETPTYLVELPGVQRNAPRPSSLPSSRPRRSTIVSAFELPNTAEEGEEPLEQYVRRNLTSFRRSLTSEDLQQLIPNKPSKLRDGRVVVNPMTAEDIERDLMDQKKQGNGKDERLDHNHHKRHKEETPYKQPKYRSEYYLEERPHKHRDSNKSVDSHSNKRDTNAHRHKGYKANQDERPYQKSEVIAFPAVESISAANQSPFATSKEHRPSSKIKVEVSIESLDEEPFYDRKHKGKHKHHSKRDQSDTSSKHRSDQLRHSRDRESSNSHHKKPKKHRNKERSRSNSSYCLSEVKSLRRSENSSQRNSAKQGRQSNDLYDSSKTQKPFGQQDYSVFLLSTQDNKGNAGGGAGKVGGKGTHQRGDAKKKNQNKPNRDRDREQPPKSKKTKSVTKVIAKKRYHIQIPEHGRPETWFNVRFNMNDDNNVEMNYEGPVKIDNYYSSKNYS